MLEACKNIRRDILRVSHESGHGHIPTCFSIVEILWAAYRVMRHDPVRPDWEERDLLVLSKGHGALGHYAALARLGYFPIDKVLSFGHFGSDFGCHADRTKVPGVEVSTGSLGHGIGVAAGMALALKLKKSPRRVIAVIGDGESNEGTVWEAVMVAVDRGLQNLTIVCDYNRSQGRSLQMQDPAAHFRGFGCQTAEVDGHCVEALEAALRPQGEGPQVVVARTVKGFGCRTLSENVFAWHRKSPSDREYEALLQELEAA